ncbi:hypothetical protein QBC35DRAFT_502731 [Podospora australis]|uniref:NAD-dependent epimerase/dehydratase domain-containing protein n=1 Tax=Podospora australis TaxID=1536484 RepID=A0AAN7AER6_9PEZI|nr:hypothetical protein QBC35DRAFT_502731 [Podospora australis]
MSWPTYVLVTGATGFIGAHVVDSLLSRGLRVRGATRSAAKGDVMLAARPATANRLDFVEIDDFGSHSVDLSPALAGGIDAVIHVASPFTYDTENNEDELIIPAINGVKAILGAAARSKTVKRVVITSSFAAVLDADRKAPPYFTYTADDWNPLTYTEAAAAETSAVVAYRGSKKFAELAAWEFVNNHNKPGFDIVTLCPPMTFGPVVHPVTSPVQLNDSNAQLWKVAIANKKGGSLPVARVPFWIDVRDLAEAHAQALLKPEAGGKRYIPAAPERFSYGLAGDIIRAEFPEFADIKRKRERQTIDKSHGVDGFTVSRELGIRYRSFRETVVDLVRQVAAMR